MTTEARAEMSSQEKGITAVDSFRKTFEGISPENGGEELRFQVSIGIEKHIREFSKKVQVPIGKPDDNGSSNVIGILEEAIRSDNSDLVRVAESTARAYESYIGRVVGQQP